MTVTQQDGWPLPVDDPYPGLRRLQERAPVHALPELDAHLVMTHEVASQILHGEGWSSDPANNAYLAQRLALPTGNDAPLLRSLLFSDPPEHTRLRAALRGHLTPRAVDRLRPRITSVVAAAVQWAAEETSVEVMNDIAYPVPLAIISELLDVPVQTAEVFRDQTTALTATLDPLATEADIEEAVSAAFTLMLELVPLVAGRRTDPGPDVLSALASPETGLDADEAIVMTLLLLAAGHETTANLIGNMVACLHDQPDIARALRREPYLIPGAVEEFLRFVSPVQLTARSATREQQIGDVVIPAGGQALISLAAVNRDPVVFQDPDRIDVRREPGRHLAFGHGAHFCAGAALARAEAEETLQALLALDPPLEDREMRLTRGTSPTFRRIRVLHLTA